MINSKKDLLKFREYLQDYYNFHLDSIQENTEQFNKEIKKLREDNGRIIFGVTGQPLHDFLDSSKIIAYLTEILIDVSAMLQANGIYNQDAEEEVTSER